MHLEWYSLVKAGMMAALIPSVAGHANILSVQGLKDGIPAGPGGMVLGLDPTTPRNGGAIDPNQRDVTIFLQRRMSLWSGCGQSIMFGILTPDTLIPKLAAKGQIAQALAGGQLMMVLHQVNGDGNGPFTCGIDSMATAARGSFKSIKISKQVPGSNPALNTVVTTQFPFIVNIPANLKCEGSFGGKKNICLMRCQNFAINGPFGACIPFELVTSLRSSFGKKREEPEKEKPASEEQIKAMMEKMTKNIPQKRATTGDGVTTDNVLAALTEGDDVPASELQKLKTQVDRKIENDSLSTKLKKEGKKHRGDRFNWRNRKSQKLSRPPAAPTKGV